VVVYLLKCPNCGKEIINDENAVCPDCGKSVLTEIEENQTNSVQPQKQPDLVFAAALLTLISAAFVASVGYVGLYQYTSLVDFFGSTALPSNLQGFLVFGAISIVSSVCAMASGMFMLKRKNFKFSMVGQIALIVSVIVTYVFTPSVSYSFDVKAILMFAEVTVFLFAIISGLFVSSANTEFS
jgi:DNA-directed RNA polymerase subunit RPC12/RpoP